MTGSLESVNAKLDRARLHLAELDVESERIENLGRDAVFVDYDAERAHDVVRFRTVPKISETFPLVLGDAIHNLRSALDHLACQIVIGHELDVEEGPGGTQFPILDETRKSNVPDGRYLPYLNPPVPIPTRELLDEVQPYKRPYAANHDLYPVKHLDNCDKHRELVVTIVSFVTIGWVGDRNMVGANQGPYEDGDEICRFESLTGKPDPDFKPTIPMTIRFDQPEAGNWSPSESAADLLRQHSLTYITNEVIPRFGHLVR